LLESQISHPQLFKSRKKALVISRRTHTKYPKYSKRPIHHEPQDLDFESKCLTPQEFEAKETRPTCEGRGI